MNYGVVLMVFHLHKAHQMNKAKFGICIALLNLMLCRNLYADTLTEAMVLDSVKQHYPLVKAAIANIQKARAEYLAAKGGFDPKLRSSLIAAPARPYQNIYSNTELNVPITDSGNNFFTGYRIGQGNFPVYYQERETFDQGEVKVGVDFPLLRDRDIDSRRAKILQTKIKTQINQEELNLIKLQAEQAGAISYWDWYIEGQKLLLHRHLLDLANTRQKALEKSVEAGNVANIEKVDNNRIIMQRINGVTAQTVAFQKAALTLSLFYRDNQGHPIVARLESVPQQKQIKPTKLIFKDEQHADAMINQHPAIRRLEAERNLSYVDFQSAKNKLLPMFNNRIYVAHDFGGGNPPLNRTTVNYELVFELPFFQREARGEITAANKLITRINEQQNLQHDNLVVLLQNAINEIQAQQAIVKASLSEIKMAMEVEKAENLRFSHGDSNLFLINQREIATVEAQMRYMDSIGSYYKAIANLRFAMGLSK